MTGLGGRLQLTDRAALDDTARELFDDITATAVAWARRSGFAATIPDGRLIGPFNPSLLNPGLAAGFLKLQAAEQRHTRLDESTRQVVILTVGAVWQSPYELYDQATQLFGPAGIFDVTMLTGIYQTVCAILNAFAIPAPNHHPH